MTEYLIRDFKGHSVGYEYNEKTDSYTWFVTEPAPIIRPTLRERIFGIGRRWRHG